ncbi:MAG: acetyl-CoA decarbonylase/synthase complex subunit alpha/beta, partial [Candidatus Bipolaricaulia bacterium]
AEELIEALKYVNGYEPEEPWLGFTGDAVLRLQGIKLVDGRMPGFAACVGALPTNEEAVELARSLQERSILVFMASNTAGRSMAEQLAEEGVEMGWDTFLVPYGKDTSAAVLALNFAARAAMTFGGVKPGDLEAARKILMYNKERVYAFVLALGADHEPSGNGDQLLTDEKYATAAGAINFGFPVISDVGIPQILPRGICTYEHVVSGIPRAEIVKKAVEVRGLKLKMSEIPIPVPYGAGFEGERVRKEQMQVQFGGKYTEAFELVRGRPMDAIKDGSIELIGPDIDEVEEGGALPFGVVVEVAGRDFREDFETVVERRIHEFSSWAYGVFHMGQRAIVWVRISKEAYAKGFRLKHYGEVLVAKLREEFSAIIDKIQVKIYTDLEKLAEPLEEARTVYRQRDDRIKGMIDEDIDTFYSCVLCQSYAPDHVCVVTPERLGLCGAYTWLDCAASFEMNAHGPNQPIKKGVTIDERLGQWRGVNEYLEVASNGNLERFNAYSMMEDPMTSCGCFECITAILPETNGVMIVNREFEGMTPIGMSFSTMAGQIGGGIQTPGFVGMGKLYISSRKFISAEGGLERVVWMPKALKDEIRDRLEERLADAGKADFLDKIATEDDATTSEELLAFLEKVEHPVSAMEPMM